MMIFLRWVVFCVFLLTSLGFSQESLDLPIQWKTGDSLKYEIVKSTQRTEDGRATHEEETYSYLDIEVLSAGTEGYVLAWTLDKVDLGMPLDTDNPNVQRSLERLKNGGNGWRVILQLDSTAEIIDVQNWRELKESIAYVYEEMAEVIVKEMQRRGEDASIASKLLEMTTSQYRSRETIEETFTEEAQIFFLLLGKSFPINEPVEYGKKLPKIFGLQLFPKQTEVTVERVDHAYNQAVITWKLSVDPEEARRIIEDNLKLMASQAGLFLSQGDLPQSVTLKDEAEYLVDISSGWLERVDYKRYTIYDGNKEEDSIIIKRRRW